MSMWNKAKLYLGLAADEEYEQHDAVATTAPGGVAPAGHSGQRAVEEPEPIAQQQTIATPVVRPIPAPATPPTSMAQQRAAAAASGNTSVVRPIPAPTQPKPHVVSPVAFNEAQEVADHYKEKQPVIINLQNADRDLSRRLIDFASGLCYGLGGHMEKVAEAVYMLTPSDVSVSAEDRRMLQEQGLHDA